MKSNIKRCERCGRKTGWAFNHFDITVSYCPKGTLFTFGGYNKYTLCKECSNLAKEVVEKFIDELTAVENPLYNGPYIIGQDYNTKDWWIYDDTQNKKLDVRFNKYEDAYFHTCELLNKLEKED